MGEIGGTALQNGTTCDPALDIFPIIPYYSLITELLGIIWSNRLW